MVPSVARTATDGTTTEIPIGLIYPKSIGSNPTQIYETISMVLLSLLPALFITLQEIRVGSVMVSLSCLVTACTVF